MKAPAGLPEVLEAKEDRAMTTISLDHPVVTTINTFIIVWNHSFGELHLVAHRVGCRV